MIIKNGHIILKKHNDTFIDLITVKISPQGTIDLPPNLQFKTVTDNNNYLISLKNNIMPGFTYKLATEQDIRDFYIDEITNNYNLVMLSTEKLKQISDIINSD